MALSKIKAFLVVLIFVIVALFAIKIFNYGFYFQEGQVFGIIFNGSMMSVFLFLMVNKPIVEYFDNKHYRKQDDINWERGLGRTIRETQAINEVKLDFMAKENELKLKYLMSVAQIQIESNQYLMSLYEQARLNQRQNNQSLAHQQLALIEEELRKQGYNL